MHFSGTVDDSAGPSTSTAVAASGADPLTALRAVLGTEVSTPYIWPPLCHE